MKLLKVITLITCVVGFCFFSAAFSVASAQQKKITGVVVDELNDPLAGVAIVVKGTTSGTVTDMDGKFDIQVPNTNSELVFSFIGFLPQTIRVGNNQTIQVTLREDTKQLDEVVVTALDMSKEQKKLGFNVSQIKSEKLVKTAEVNIVNALQGKVAGVNIDQGAGGALGAPRILIRGNSTLGKNNQPIFVVDGIILENNEADANSFGNDLKNLNPEDYESVSILRGSAAAALYGSRAINGVVLITTKKGKKKSGFGVNLSQSIVAYDPYKGPEMQNEFGGGSVGAYFTDWRDPGYKSNENFRTKVFPTDSQGNPYIDPQIGRELENWGPRFEGQKVLNYDGTWTTWEAKPNNFLDFYQTGTTSRTNVAVDGGGESTTFRVSYTHEDNKGITPTTRFKKDAFNVRTTYDVNQYLGFDVGADYTMSNYTNPTNTSIGPDVLWTYPRNFDPKYWMKPENYTSIFGGLPDPKNNINETNRAPGLEKIFEMFENKNVRDENMFRGRLTTNIKINESVRGILEGNVSSLSYTEDKREQGKKPGFGEGRYFIKQSHKLSYFLKAMILAQKQVGDFNFSGSAGTEMNRMKSQFISSITEGGLIIPGVYDLTNSKETITTERKLEYNKTINSVYATFDIDYKNQLYLQSTWRGDWSSALVTPEGKGTPFYNYPSVSLAWLFTETFKLPDFISFGKLKGNIAALGKDTDPFKLNNGYKLMFKEEDMAMNIYTNSLVPTATFYDKKTMPAGIKPERKIAKEIGLEMKFFKNRYGFDLTYYRDNTFDQIMPLATPIESGTESIFINAGNIQNSGIELTIDYNPISTKDFEWNGSLNYSRNRNKIVKLYEGRDEFNLDDEIHTMKAYAVVGKSYGTIRSNANSKKYQAVDAAGNKVDHPNNGLPILSWRSDARCAFPQQSKEWEDIGDINPDFRAGLSNSFRYKNLTLDVQLNAKIGGDIALYSYSFGTHTGVLPNTLHGRDAAHGGITWTSKWDGETYDDGILPNGVFEPNQKITQPDGSQVNVGGMTFKEVYDAGYVEPTHAPQYYYRYGSWTTAVTDYWVFENSYVSLKSVTLTYQFPQRVCSALRLNSLVLSIYGSDLCYLYNSLPYDFNPENNNSNKTTSLGEKGFLPMTRSFGGTLRVRF